MFAATGYELLSMLQDGAIANEDWIALGVAFVASAVTAFVAVKWLLRYIQSHRFTAFAVYRLVLGIALPVQFFPEAGRKQFAQLQHLQLVGAVQAQLLAFEADELYRIVDLMRHLRASKARLHVREEIPFYTGRRRPMAEIVASLP